LIAAPYRSIGRSLATFIHDVRGLRVHEEFVARRGGRRWLNGGRQCATRKRQSANGERANGKRADGSAPAGELDGERRAATREANVTSEVIGEAREPRRNATRRDARTATRADDGRKSRRRSARAAAWWSNG